LELHRTGCGRPAATDFRHDTLEPLGEIDSRPMRIACDRIDDRSPSGLDQARHLELRGPTVDIHIEVDRRENRIMKLLKGRGKHLEEGGAGLRILATHDPQKGLALLGRCALIDNRNNLPAALMNGAGPRCDGCDPQAIETCVAMVTSLDIDGHDSVTVAVGGARTELAGATISAVAMHELSALDGPIGVRHFTPSVSVIILPFWRILMKERGPRSSVFPRNRIPQTGRVG